MSTAVSGFLYSSVGIGHRKVVKMDFNNTNFFRDMFQKEIVDKNWTRDPATLNIIMSFFIYNPNQFLIQERKINIEFVSVGGFINIDHTPIIANVLLSRDANDNMISYSIILNGVLLAVLQLYIIQGDVADRELAMQAQQGDE